MAKNKKWKQLQKERDAINSRIASEEKKLKRKLKALKMEGKSACNHKKMNGESLLRPTNDEGGVRCKSCKAEFSSRIIQKSQRKAIKKALNSIIEQLRNKTSVEDDKTPRRLTEFQLDLADILALYDEVVKRTIEESRGKKPRKNKKNKNRTKRTGVGFGYGG